MIATGAVLVPLALANHTATNGAVTQGPDVVMLDCVGPNRTTSTGTTHPSPSPTDAAGRNPQAAATGSGCTVQAPTGRTRSPETGAETGDAVPYRVRARFTFNGVPVPGRTIRFTSNGGTLSNSTPQPNPSPTPSSATNHFCITDADGICSVQVSSAEPAVVTVTAQEQGSGESATENVEFRDNSTRVQVLDETHRVAIRPAEDDYTGFNCEGGPGSTPFRGTGGTAGTGGTTGCPNDTTRAPSGTPARPVQVTYQLLDEGVFAGDLPFLPGREAQARRPLTNRTVLLSLSNSAFFFTPNCGAITFSSNTAVTPNTGDYRQCTFRNPPQDGQPAGELTSLGNSVVVTSDDGGRVTVTVAVDRSTEFDDDGLAAVLVSLSGVAGFGPTGQPTVAATEGAPTAATESPSGTPPAPLNFNTRNRPINGIRTIIASLAASQAFPTAVVTSAVSAQPTGASGPVTGFRRTFRPITATTQPFEIPVNTTTRFAVYLNDQFSNLVRVPETDVTVSASGTGVILERECRTAGTGSNGATFGQSVCSNPAGPNTNFNAGSQPQTFPTSSAGNNPTTGSTSNDRTTGSYQPANQNDYRNYDPFRVTSTTGAPITISATWQAPQTTFVGGSSSGATTGPTATPTVNPTTASPTASATATPTVSPTATASPTTSVSPTATATPTLTPTASPTSPAPTGPPQRFASRVTLISSHSRITAGNTPRLSGQVFDQNGSPLGGVNLTFFKKSFGESFYSEVSNGRVTSGADGRFSLAVRPINQTSYGVNTDDGRANSNIVQIRVNARMDILSPAASSRVSNPVTLSGRLLPAYNARPIGLAYINSAGRYVYLGQAASRNGAWSVRANAVVPRGTYTFVVYMSATQGTDRGARSVRLTVG